MPGEDGAPSQAGADAQAGIRAEKSISTPDERREQAKAEPAGVGEMGRQGGDEGLPEVLPTMPGLKVRLKKQRQ